MRRERERERIDTDLKLSSTFSLEVLNAFSHTNFRGSPFNDEMIPFWLKYMNSVLSMSSRDRSLFLPAEIYAIDIRPGQVYSQEVQELHYQYQ